MSSSTSPTLPLEGIRVLDCSLLAPGAAAMYLADLGAEVIKIEPPGGDYVRELTWPIIEGASLMHHQVSRGKKSIELDLRQHAGKKVFEDLVRQSDVVIEAMRPGALERRGLGYKQLIKIKPELVFCCLSGYGMSGPYQNLPAHGLAFDSWAGLVQPQIDADGFCYIPEHPSVGMHAGPLMAAMSICAALLRARQQGQGAMIDIAQADSAAFFDWLRSGTWKAYQRPESEVTGNASDNFERRAPGTAGMQNGVRYQYYQTSDGHILFMASEQEFWRNFCNGVGHPEWFERWPGNRYGDHAVGNRELQALLRGEFQQRSTKAWMQFAVEHNTAIAPVNTPKTLDNDPHFHQRLPWMTAATHVADLLPLPTKFVDENWPEPGNAPSSGEHNRYILTDILGYEADKIEQLLTNRAVS